MKANTLLATIPNSNPAAEPAASSLNARPKCCLQYLSPLGAESNANTQFPQALAD